jgi:3D (Asp-Asp-Asp) domain-containing protein
MDLVRIVQTGMFRVETRAGVRLYGPASESKGDCRFEGPIFSDGVNLGDFAHGTGDFGLAAGPRRGRLRITHGWPAYPDGFADDTRRTNDARDLEENARQGSPDLSENECPTSMHISPTNASDRTRDVLSTRRSRRLAIEAGLFGVALLTVAASAMWAKRGGFEFSAPALAAVEQIGAVEARIAPVALSTIANVATENAPSSNEAHATPAPEFRVESVEVIDPANAEIRYFDGRAVRPSKIIWMETTAYSPDERSCGIWADGVTASNRSVWTNGMKLVAADTKVLKMHSLVSIPGYHNAEIVPVLDRGGAIKGNKLDLLYPTHERALQWGRQRLPVTVWEYVD